MLPNSTCLCNTAISNCVVTVLHIQIQKLESTVSIVACFETLCGVRSVSELLKLLPGFCSADDAEFVDKCCNWSPAKHWAQWWTRCDHLRMLSKSRFLTWMKMSGRNALAQQMQ